MSDRKRSYADALIAALMQWQAENPEELHWDNEVLAEYMIKKLGFGLERRIIKREIMKQLARALNRKKVRNEQGKRVKAYHSARLPVKTPDGRVVQKQLWGDRLTMSETMAHAALDQGLKQAEGMCKALHNSAQDLNTNNPNLADRPIQLTFDFSYVAQAKSVRRVEKIRATLEPENVLTEDETTQSSNGSGSQPSDSTRIDEAHPKPRPKHRGRRRKPK